ncbi:hypothetical protein HDA40_005938 [Hamadaea flava]|uniref:DUF6232 family protein n=1 Tax=Hamadaea flava TaxID=1742688 RepID=A0ABV8LUK1_9ACTN|nr:DUF6232 family protein [Hamadaea flava]MCP2327431.1 hypothetical protein [Hamadaea flava]
MIVYYRDRHVQVTSEALHVGESRIPLARLQYVWHREGVAEPAVRLRRTQRGVIGFALIVGALLALIGVLYVFAGVVGQAAGAGRVLLPLAGVVALIGFAGPLLEMALHRVDHSVDQGHQVHEICAVIDGVERRLIRIADTHRFGKIYRALERALEDTEGGALEAAEFAQGSEDGT